MSIRDNIKKLRDLTGATQEDLADIAGVTRAAVSIWEMGSTEPRMGAIQRIADHYHIKKSNLIEDGGMDHMAVAVSGRLYEVDSGLELSEDEQKLINLYRAANAQGKESIMAVAHVSSGMGQGFTPGLDKAV